MSRILKFRAWEVAKKKWMKIDDGECYYIPLPKVMDESIVIEQYTGLKDKNGKEIYERDIVEVDKYGKFQIIWNEWPCKFGFDKIGKREREEPLLSQGWAQKAEVIGNIHENPELLEGKDGR